MFDKDMLFSIKFAMDAMEEMLAMIPDGRSKWHVFDLYDQVCEDYERYSAALVTHE